jgi:hypothetical protein
VLRTTPHWKGSVCGEFEKLFLEKSRRPALAEFKILLCGERKCSHFQKGLDYLFENRVKI